MANGQRPTTKEHFVPQAYLRGFSADGKHIWRFDVQEDSICREVSIRDICYKRNLYEFRNETGYLARNYLERIFGILEYRFSVCVHGINGKAHEERNYQSRSFLTSQEKELLQVFLAVQILRYPEMLTLSEDLAREYLLPENPPVYLAKNISLQMMLPFLKELTDQESYPLYHMLRWFENMAYIVGVAPFGTFFTSDHPAFLYAQGGYTPSMKTPDEVIYPLTNELVLYMLPRSQVEPGNRNRVFRMTDDDILKVKKSVVAASGRWIYSVGCLSPDDIALIKRIKNGGE